MADGSTAQRAHVNSGRRPAAIVRSRPERAPPAPAAKRESPPPPRVTAGQILRIGVLVMAAVLLRAPMKSGAAMAGPPMLLEKGVSSNPMD